MPMDGYVRFDAGSIFPCFRNETVLCYAGGGRFTENWVSKKELLQLTGISYGQLYRWKRKHLIPESWFVRRATFTGQETFFPRDAIIERVTLILSLKSETALDELAERLQNPEQWQELLSASQLWAAAEGRPIPTVITGIWADQVSRREFLAGLAWVRLGGSLPVDAAQAWVAVLRTVPADWLDYPGLEIIGWPRTQGWQFAVLRSSASVWLGGLHPPFRADLGPVWQSVKSAWQAVARAQLESLTGIQPKPK